MTILLGRAGGATRARSHAWGKTSSSQGCYCAAEGAPPLIFNFLRRADGAVSGVPATLRERGAGAAAASTSLHSVPHAQPRSPSGGTQGGEGEAESTGAVTRFRAVPAARGEGRAPAVRWGRASPGPSPPRQPSAGRCRSGSGKPRPPPRVWRAWAHPRHCLRGGPCLLRAPAGGAALVAAMLKGCAPPQTRQRAPALGSSHPAC